MGDGEQINEKQIRRRKILVIEDQIKSCLSWEQAKTHEIQKV